jgi:YD repeat-containing protein
MRTKSFRVVCELIAPFSPLARNPYDTKGNLLTTTTPSPDGGTTPGSVTTFTYNSNGTLATIKDPLNNLTTIAYFSTGLIQYIQDAQGNRTTFAYDARGNRTSATDANRKVTGFTYDLGEWGRNVHGRGAVSG